MREISISTQIERLTVGFRVAYQESNDRQGLAKSGIVATAQEAGILQALRIGCRGELTCFHSRTRGGTHRGVRSLTVSAPRCEVGLKSSFKLMHHTNTNRSR